MKGSSNTGNSGRQKKVTYVDSPGSERSLASPSNNTRDYGAIEMEDFDMHHLLEDGPNPMLSRDMRRWSVLEKLNRRYYCRIRSCDECFKMFNCKCILSTSMLITFISLLVLFTRAILFNKTFGALTYDFIVVGAGSSGSVLTRKLLDAGARVLLLEAGNATQFDLGGIGYSEAPVTIYDIPFLWSAAGKFPTNIWSFNINSNSYYINNAATSSSSSSTSGSTSGSSGASTSTTTSAPKQWIEPIVAKGLGGGSVINAMVYMRALMSDIQSWNIPTVTWDKMQATYNNLETYNHIIDEEQLTSADYHVYRGTSGPIVTSELPQKDFLSTSFVTAAMQAGMAFNNDFNDPRKSREGVGYYQFNIKDGIRTSPARALLAAYIKQRHSGLQIELRARVRRILLLEKIIPEMVQSEDGRFLAYGIEYEQDGNIKTALLGHGPSTINKLKNFEGERCIILSAGAIMSPELLMKSGIGDMEVLKAADVDHKVHNKQIGRNLQDHPAIHLIAEAHPSISTHFPNPFALSDAWVKYFSAVEDLKNTQLSAEEKRQKAEDVGVIGTTGFAAGLFLKSPFHSNASIPDIQVTLYPSLTLSHVVKSTRYNYEEELKKYPHVITLVFTIALLHSDATYKIELCKTGSQQVSACLEEDTPISEEDVQRFQWAIAQVRGILRAAPMSQICQRELIPGPQLAEKDTAAWIQQAVSPSSHWVGSVRLGNDAATSALDEDFTVRGVKSLRVVDASAIPKMPNGNPHTTVTALASIAADVILST